MAEPEKRERPQTIKEMRQQSPCWERWDRPAIVQFQLSDKYWIGVPFNSVSSTECIEREDGSCEMGIEWKDGEKVQRIFITGPKVPDLFGQFCVHEVGIILADGKDITRVDLLTPTPKS